MSKFLFLLAAGIAFSPASGFNFFKCCACNSTEYFDCVDDICEEAMYGYYKTTLDDGYAELQVVDHSDSANIAVYNTGKDEIAIDFSDLYSHQQATVMPQTPVVSLVDDICEDAMYSYYKCTPTLDDGYVDLQVVDYNTGEDKIAIDFNDISTQQQVPVIPQIPLIPSMEIIFPKASYAYFFESETEDYKLDGFDSEGNSLHSSRCDEE